MKNTRGIVVLKERLRKGYRTIPAPDHEKHFEALKILLECRWWGRVRVIQEMGLPSEIKFYYGEETFDVDLLRTAIEKIENYNEGSRGPLKPNDKLPARKAITQTVYHCLFESGDASFLLGPRKRDVDGNDYPSWLADFHVQQTPPEIVWGEQQRLSMAKKLSASGACSIDRTVTRWQCTGALVLRAVRVDKIVQDSR
ncbi:hypothetical protein ASPWEDRAFT_24071 [Aspergillus wentii DTO 134E9]|uniref:Uncharacterized protein n=1 Tax=Aspergillus wentii DTO 134E9 TaxID=1073089 RepID=A0A1L9RT43_ASPWE|nr:uncharacterized protein ASPWEDRAFT_24071 [Aspergillus wentii DTO 134E9]OJJ38102.1 hypothetical protein ASPWEDRAFT_24071 [Aspergillus wentii DTO 134E9]